jgi:uncharacterized protein (DUF486 family)
MGVRVLALTLWGGLVANCFAAAVWWPTLTEKERRGAVVAAVLLWGIATIVTLTAFDNACGE